MSKSKFRESLDSLTAEQAASVLPEMKDWLAGIEKATPNYSGLTDQQLEAEVYRIESEARLKTNG